MKAASTLLILIAAAVPTAAQTTVFINEIHYDNSGTDTGEAIEVAGPVGTALTGWSLVRYNGSNGQEYGTTMLTGTIPNHCGGLGVIAVSYPSNGLQNGSPDGIALVDNTTAVVQFISYEGSFTATNGPANGLTSTDIGVSEGSGTPVGHSLQLSGTGTTYEDFSWQAAALNTFGNCNTGQFFGTPTANLVINEIDYDQPSTDAAEFVEIKNAGTSAANLGTFSLQLVNGSGGGGSVYNTISLPSVSLAAGDYFVVCANAATVPNCDLDASPDTNFIQNGAPDAVALLDGTEIVDTVSYEGDTGAPYTEGSGVGLEDSSSTADVGISRCPDGTDTDVNNSDFVSVAITPGEANECFVGPEAVLIINEILQNPAAVSDTNGEWFELVNGTPDPVDIDGWTIKDDGSNIHVIANGGPLVIPAGGFLVLGTNADAGANGGVAIDYQYSNVFLGNGSDELILLDTSLSEVDRVEWDNGATFPDPNGASMALKFPVLDNNVGANWCQSKTPFGAGDLGTPGAPNDCLASLVINEVDADQTSTDDAEFIEIFDGGAGGTDLSGLVVVLYNGSDDASYNPAIDLDGFSTNGDGFFVICGDAANVPGCDLDVSPDTNLIQNGADAVALYAGDAAAFPNDTPLTTEGLLDALVYDTNDGDDSGLLALLNSGQPQVNENGQGNKDLHSNQRCPNGFGGQRNTDSYFQDTPTAGGFNNCPPLEIFEIQGNGLASPYDGFVVGTDADVVTAVAPNGFFMQTPSAGTDGDINTSDGIFVFTGGAPGVAVGDLVDVEGEVTEFFGFTEIGGPPAVSVVGSGFPPPAVLFDAGVPTPDPTVPSCAIEFECYEGMLVDVAGGTVTGPNQRFGTDPIAEVHITAAPARTFREPGVEFPGLGMPPIPTWDGNPEVFELDLDKLLLPNMIIPAGSSFSATGVLGFEFGGYELWPTQITINAAPLPVSVSPRQPLEFTVGSLNMFRFFDDVDDDPTTDANGQIRNDFVVSTAEYLRRRDKFVSYILDVLDAPDILAVQEAEKIEVLQDLAAAINAVEASVVYTAHLIEGNDVGTIDVGFLTRDTIAVDAVTQYGYTETLTFDGSLLNDRPPLMLEARCVSDGADIPIKVIVVHNRSLNGIDDRDDGARVRQKRLEQAQFVAQLVQDEQDADPNIELVVVGDFNAYEFTDGYVDVVGQIAGDFEAAENLVSGADLVDPNLTKWVTLLPPSERYSFIFQGNAQALDHALTTVGLDPRVTNFEFGRGNADAAVDLINDGLTPENLPLRSSDHDGFVLYLTKDLDGDGVVDNLDFCPGTVIPESVPTRELGTNRWALVDEDGSFDTKKPNGRGSGLDRSFTLGDTAGCSCEQIIEELDLGSGHVKYGCSTSAMEDWIAKVNE